MLQSKKRRNVLTVLGLRRSSVIQKTKIAEKGYPSIVTTRVVTNFYVPSRPNICLETSVKVFTRLTIAYLVERNKAEATRATIEGLHGFALEHKSEGRGAP